MAHFFQRHLLAQSECTHAPIPCACRAAVIPEHFPPWTAPSPSMTPACAILFRQVAVGGAGQEMLPWAQMPAFFPKCPPPQTHTSPLHASPAGTDNSTNGCGRVCSPCPTEPACLDGNPKKTCAWVRTGDKNKDGYCTDTATDNDNCGTVGNECGTGQSCNGGLCSCPPDYAFCGGTCVPIKTDRENCGSCGNKCPSSQTCVSGKCACPAGQSKCDSGCKVRTAFFRSPAQLQMVNAVHPQLPC